MIMKFSEKDGEDDLFEQHDIDNFLEAIQNKESTFYIGWSEGFFLYS